MKERFCKICGEYFVGVTNECYCSEPCKNEALRMQQEDKIMKKRLSRKRNSAPPNKLDEIMKECDKLGISYSEWKKKQILDGVERIKI